MAIVKKTLSQWGARGLNLSKAGFSKLQVKEAQYEESTPKYNLEPESFENYKQSIIEKIERMHAMHTFSLEDNSSGKTVTCNVIKQYISLLQTDMEHQRDDRWPQHDPTLLIRMQQMTTQTSR